VLTETSFQLNSFSLTFFTDQDEIFCASDFSKYSGEFGFQALVVPLSMLLLLVRSPANI
jgi:hypothetical protein